MIGSDFSFQGTFIYMVSFEFYNNDTYGLEPYIFIFTEEITDSNDKFSDGTWTRIQISWFLVSFFPSKARKLTGCGYLWVEGEGVNEEHLQISLPSPSPPDFIQTIKWERAEGAQKSSASLLPSKAFLALKYSQKQEVPGAHCL